MDIKKALEDERDRSVKALVFTPGQALKGDFTETDFDELTFADGIDIVGRKSLIGRGTLRGVGKVICTVIESSQYTPKYLELYRNIQMGASVQVFYGILSAKNQYFAVMESLEDLPTLRQLCADKTIKNLNPLERLEIAHELGKTVAWFHRAEIQLKSLSDATVIIRKLDSGQHRPVLIGLERSRMVSLFRS